MYQHSKEIKESGTPLSEAKKAIIMLHGRGANAEDIMSLAAQLNLSDAAIFAPQATNNSWYPYSFLAPLEDNQPALDSALELIDNTVEKILAAGVPKNKLYFLGFSQGACLALEYTARHAADYGGVIAFTGGLIGEQLNPDKYSGDFIHTPVFITTGNPDPHVPLTRVHESVEILEKLNAEVSLRVYNGRPHIIQFQEIDLANKLVLF
ncbi:MAG: alpha/beta hydrolase [Sphingobacteriaceae bacterium]